MDDNQIPAIGQDAGELTGGTGQGPVTPGQAPQGEPPVEPPQYLTQADLQKALEARDQQWERKIQSRLDKADSRMQQRLAALQGADKRALEVAKQAGFSPEQLGMLTNALSQDSYRRAMAAEPAQGAEPNPPANFDPQNPATWSAEQVADAGNDLARKGGLTLEDPEQAAVITDGTALEYLASIQAAVRMKQARLKGQPAQASGGANPARMPAHAPAGGRAKTDLSKLSIREMMEVASQDDKRLRG